MTHLRTRLIALVDFSMYSNALLELTSRWCEDADADLVLIHKVPGLVPAMTESDVRKRLISGEKKSALEKLKKWSEENISPPTKVEFVIDEKNLLVMISEILEEGTNDFIVMGIKGSGMLKRLLLGSVTTNLINELNHTIIAVPEKLCAAKLCNMNPRRLVITLTDKYPLNEAALDNLLITFKSRIESILFVSVIDENENAEDDMEFLSGLTERYKKNAPSTYKIFRGKNVFEEVKSEIQHDSDTVLVVQKGSRTLSDQFFRKFFINQVVGDGSIPMVVLPTL